MDHNRTADALTSNDEGQRSPFPINAVWIILQVFSDFWEQGLLNYLNNTCIFRGFRSY